LTYKEAQEIYMTNKELFEEIRKEQKQQAKILEQHNLQITTNKYKIDTIEKTLSRGNILKWNFAGIIVANLITYLIQIFV
jgi:ATP-dependent helicase YprA (DUF1998 family)